MKQLNSKLTARFKDLNIVLERFLEKSNDRKIIKTTKGGGGKLTQVKMHEIEVKKAELENTN